MSINNGLNSDNSFIGDNNSINKIFKNNAEKSINERELGDENLENTIIENNDQLIAISHFEIEENLAIKSGISLTPFNNPPFSHPINPFFSKRKTSILKNHLPSKEGGLFSQPKKKQLNFKIQIPVVDNIKPSLYLKTIENNNIIKMFENDNVDWVNNAILGIKIYNDSYNKILEKDDKDKMLTLMMLKNLPKSTSGEGNTGTNGSYFLQNDQSILGIFKPADEEMGSLNCPNPEFRSEQTRQRFGIQIGKGSIRECAGYFLSKNIIPTPPTVLLTLPNCNVFSTNQSQQSKKGSFQQFVPQARDIYQCKDHFQELLRESAEVRSQMRMIAIWDVMVFNTDRNRGNLLITQDNQLIPIDHGCIAPNGFIDNFKAFWLGDPIIMHLMEEPFSFFEKQMINEFQMEEKLVEIKLKIPDISDNMLDTLRASYCLIKEGIEQRFSLKEIVLLFQTPPEGSFLPSLARTLFNLAKIDSVDIKSFNENLRTVITRAYQEFTVFKDNNEILTAELIEVYNKKIFTGIYHLPIFDSSTED